MYDYKEVLIRRSIVIAKMAPAIDDALGVLCTKAVEDVKALDAEMKKEYWHLQEISEQCNVSLKELLNAVALLRVSEMG